MPNFSTVERVLATVRAGDPVERIRQENRVKVTDMANCVPPLTEEEAKKLGIKINSNWGGMMLLLSHARRQYLSAFLSNQYFFKVELPFAPAEKQSEWGAFITENINRPMQKSLSYFELHRSRWSSVVTHGVGPMIWPNEDGWEPNFTAMCDLRIATDTTLDFKNLGWFAVRHIYTPFELLNEAFNGVDNNGWDKKAVAEILSNYKEVNFVNASSNYDWQTSPEKLAELVKQDGGYYAGDAMPGIPLYHFYFEDTTKANEKGWFMRVVPENGALRGAKSPQTFLWQSDKPVAKTRQEILHCQFGDLTTDAPFKYHAVRSLGFALLEPEFYDNLTRSRFMQHLHDNFNIWLRTQDPGDKGRAQVQEFSNLGMLRSGVSVVPQNERHQIDPKLVEMGMAQMQQLKQEASSTYTQQIDNGSGREQTAFETNVKMQQVNALLGGLLLTAFKYESFAYREICRRFCLKKTRDADILKFQKRCREAGIPRRFLDVDMWDVEPVTPLGMGNPTIAQAASKQLMEIRGAYPPSAQQEILHEATLVITGDARKAARWAPLGKGQDITEGAQYIQGVFGTLMQGVPIQPVERISPVEQLQALLPMIAAKVVMMEQRDNVGKPEEIAGLQAVQHFFMGLIQRLQQDPEKKQEVKQFTDQFGQLWNQVEGLAQRGQEQQQAAQQAKSKVSESLNYKDAPPDIQRQIEQQAGLQPSRIPPMAPGAQPDPQAAVAAAHAHQMLQLKQAEAVTELKAKQADHHLSQQQAGEAFVREQRRRDAETHAQIQRDNTAAAAAQEAAAAAPANKTD